MSAAFFVAVDWGTTSFRAYVVNTNGELLDERSTGEGITSVPPGGFAECLARNLAALGASALPVLASGMVGSRNGWREVPYIACPAGLDSLAAGMAVWEEGGGKRAIVPGLSCRHEAGFDVMRGEEVQVFGALESVSVAPDYWVLPGTHSKWVTTDARRIEGFRTFVTGEMYALLSERGTVGQVAADPGIALHEHPAFEAGIERARLSDAVLSTIFSLRANTLLGEMGAGDIRPFLSGFLIGREIVEATAAIGRPSGRAVIIGREDLGAAYVRALSLFGWDAECMVRNTAIDGLHALALRTLG